jgi:hypothetical protein
MVKSDRSGMVKRLGGGMRLAQMKSLKHWQQYWFFAQHIFYGAVVVLPVILAYTVGVYWIFRGKVRKSETPTDPRTLNGSELEGAH